MPIFSIEKGVFTPKMGKLDFGGISPPRNQLTTKTRFWVQRAPSQSLPGKLEVRSGNKKKEKKEKSTLGLNISPPLPYDPLYVHFSFCACGVVSPTKSPMPNFISNCVSICVRVSILQGVKISIFPIGNWRRRYNSAALPCSLWYQCKKKLVSLKHGVRAINQT